jgi:hypothetical protein
MAPIHDAANAGNVEALRRELERGVLPDMRDVNGFTPLFTAVLSKRADCVSMLLRAGADPNVDGSGRTKKFKVLHQAAFDHSLEIVRMLLEAGACVDSKTIACWRAIDFAYYTTKRHGNERVYPLLLRAGSELPKEEPARPLREDPYFSRILDAGSFKAYERAHLNALAKTLSPKLTHLLPPELVRKVVEFYLHAGFYPFTEVPATAPTATA